MGKTKKTNNNEVHVNKYEIMRALFQTEEDRNAEMAKELNEMLNVFYEIEITYKRNIVSLPFDISTDNEKTIQYIGNVLATA